MSIDWTTVLFEVINFAVLMLIMVRFVFRPVAATLDTRKAEIDALKRETASREAEAEATQARYQTELATIDVLAEQRVNEALALARGEAEDIIARARVEAQAELAKGEQELGNARRRALERFRTEVYRLGTDAARHIIRELGASELDLAFARRAANALGDAISGELRGPVEVSHGPEADAGALRELLRRELGRSAQLRLVPEPELVGGVRLRAQGHVVEASVGASLDAWYRELLRDSEGRTKD